MKVLKRPWQSLHPNELFRAPTNNYVNKSNYEYFKLVINIKDSTLDLTIEFNCKWSLTVQLQFDKQAVLFSDKTIIELQVDFTAWKLLL